MRRYLINFRKSVQDRAAEISLRAYNHYRRFGPKIYQPFKEIHSKYIKNRFSKYGKS